MTVTLGSVPRLLVALALGILVAPLATDAQSPAKVPRVGVLCPWLCPTPPSERLSVPLSEKSPDNLMADEAFRLGLRDLGYVEGQGILLEWRSALGQYERLPGLADDLVRLKVDVLVTVGAPWLRGFALANPTTPIVLAQVADPVMSGLVVSLARPGRNITGLSLLTYGPNMNDMFRRAASFVDKILKGSKPGDLPMEQPMRFEMMVNLATAKAIGAKVPPSVLMRADRVIQ